MDSLACHCWSCCHPTTDNAGQRTWHAYCHREFAERMVNVDAGRRAADGLLARLGPMIPVVVRKVTGACRLPSHAAQHAHPAHR